MATFMFEEQRVIIRFLHLRGMKPIEIHQQLSETCNDGIMDMKNVRSWVQQFKEDRTLCENKPKEPRPCTSRSEDMIDGSHVLGQRRHDTYSLHSQECNNDG